jgi:antirestriction protein ArdC
MHAQDLFEAVTAQLIADIEAGAGTWRMPWHCLADSSTPTSADGRPYRGTNALILAIQGSSSGFTAGIWSTYRSYQRHGAQVRRGEKGTTVALWKPTTQPNSAGADETDADDRPTGRGLIARTFTVFAAEQVDGADAIIARRSSERGERDTPQRIAEADRYFASTGVPIIEGGNRAYYSPAEDTIHVPTVGQFDNASQFHSTISHEACHASGHPDRLARDLTGRFGSDAYAAEELVAELGAAMWCAQSGIAAATRHDHATYLGAWLRILGTDARALVTVASKAQAAVDYLNNLAGIASYTVTTDEAEDAVVV